LKDENVTNFHPLPCVKVKSGFVSLCTVCFVDGFCAPPKRRQIMGAESKSRWGQASSTNYNSMQEKNYKHFWGIYTRNLANAYSRKQNNNKPSKSREKQKEQIQEIQTKTKSEVLNFVQYPPLSPRLCILSTNHERCV